MNSTDFVLPADHASHEHGLIGSVLIDPRVLDKVRAIVSGCDFSDAELGRLFDAIAEVSDAGFPIGDVTVLLGRLRRMQDMEFVTAALIGKMFTETPHAGHAAYYAAEVRRTAERRRWYHAGMQLAHEATDPKTDPADLVALVEQHASRISHGENDTARFVADVAQETIAEIEAARKAPTRFGVVCGISSIDEATGGFQPGELVIIAARPGCGKTAFALQTAIHAAEHGKRALFVSLEMRDRELVRRVLCSRSGIDSRDARSGNVTDGDMDRMRGVAGELTFPLAIWSPPRATVAQVRGMARYHRATGGLDLLVVDYLGLVQPDSEDRRLQRYEQVGRMTGALKALAKELSVPVLLLCQLSRESEKHEAPRLSHLRESGSIEQDADVVLMLHHPEVGSDRQPNTGSIREASLIVAKHRHGETGSVLLHWEPASTTFGAPNMAWQP